MFNPVPSLRALCSKFWCRQRPCHPNDNPVRGKWSQGPPAGRGDPFRLALSKPVLWTAVALLAIAIATAAVPDETQAQDRTRPTVTEGRVLNPYVIEMVFSENMWRVSGVLYAVTIEVNGVAFPKGLVKVRCKSVPDAGSKQCRRPLEEKWLWIELRWPIYAGDRVTFSYSPEKAEGRPLTDGAGNHLLGITNRLITNNSRAAVPTVSIKTIGTSVTEGQTLTFRLEASENDGVWPSGDSMEVTGYSGTWDVPLKYKGVPAEISYDWESGSGGGYSRSRYEMHRYARTGDTNRWDLRRPISSSAADHGPLTVNLDSSDAYERATARSICIRIDHSDGTNGTACSSSQVSGEPLTAEFDEVPASHDGTAFSFQVEFSDAVSATAEQMRGAVGATGGSVTAAAHADGSDTVWDVTVRPSGTGTVTLSLGLADSCTDTGAICTSDGRKLTTALAQEVAFAPRLSVADAEATEGDDTTLDFAVTLAPAVSDTVTVQYATSNGTATAGEDYTPTSGTLTFASNETSKTVSVPITDDEVEDDRETLTLTLSNPTVAALGDAEATGTIRNSETQTLPALTASVQNVPVSHDGANTFTFTLQFSEDVNGLSYLTLRDAFNLTHGNVTTAERQTKGQNQNWTIHIEPDGRWAVTITLPAGAVNTPDGRSLESAVTATVRRANTAATGQPTITGTTQVGETLSTSVSGISDADGLDDVSYAYRWLADDAEITDATGSSLELTDDREGKAIKVRVSFTDDNGNSESLTSAATAAVEPAGPTSPPPVPQNLTYTVNDDGHVVLSWTAPDDEHITGYQIVRRMPRQNENTLLVYESDTGTTATTYTDEDVQAGELYVYRVKAINAAGVGPRSNYVNVER